jgi:hypothetical protein
MMNVRVENVGGGAGRHRIEMLAAVLVRDAIREVLVPEIPPSPPNLRRSVFGGTKTENIVFFRSLRMVLTEKQRKR